MDKELDKKYRIALAGLCGYTVQLAGIQERIANGEVVTSDEIEDVCKHIEIFKHWLLDAKEQLGFSDGLSFMENNAFAGFHIRDGVLIGDTEKLIKIVTPWYYGFPSKANNYQFEVANFLLAFKRAEDLATKEVYASVPKATAAIVKSHRKKRGSIFKRLAWEFHVVFFRKEKQPTL